MYRVRLQDFEGPLDLLLFFIQRDELDIYDIPIASITDEYLSYVRVLGDIDLDGAGEFIYMAALLISIKARMLLPSPEVDEDGEPIDPRRELVERLLEYIRFKEASQLLEGQQEERARLFIRGQAVHIEAGGDGAAEPDYDVSVFDLIRSLQRILTEAPDEPVHEVGRVEYSVEGQRLFVLEALRGTANVGFVNLVRGGTKSFIITTFLAVLEMARNGEIAIGLAPDDEDFYLYPAGADLDAADPAEYDHYD